MKLLIVTQKVDKKDDVLGFFHRWIEQFAEQFESVTVICLYQGEYSLPKNVKVLSLGKEHGESRVKYVTNFMKYVIKERNNYDATFVHMNQEYVLLAGWLWRLWGKKVTMWRNHHAGSWLTNIAAGLCTKLFCTSKFSYTARFTKKIVFMPVGIDTGIFKNIDAEKPTKDVLFLARISPVKKPDVLINAIGLLKKENISLTASIYGDPLPKDQAYYDSLKTLTSSLALTDQVSFNKAIPNTEAVHAYNAHQIFVNLSTSGMYDKTIFEAAACERLFLASNRNLEGEVDDRFIFEEGNTKQLAQKLNVLHAMSPEEKIEYGKTLRAYVEKKHSLRLLSEKLKAELQ